MLQNKNKKYNLTHTHTNTHTYEQTSGCEWKKDREGGGSLFRQTTVLLQERPIESGMTSMHTKNIKCEELTYLFAFTLWVVVSLELNWI